tara:strand:- start:213 stop:443 length:231 start_codon:yes stop_codon:yes gene_type:complete
LFTTISGKKITIDDFILGIEALITYLKINKTLSEIGIKHNDIPQLAEDTMEQERLLINNPRELNLSDAKSIYEAAL